MWINCGSKAHLILQIIDGVAYTKCQPDKPQDVWHKFHWWDKRPKCKNCLRIKRS